jgi:hypothetical protein
MKRSGATYPLESLDGGRLGAAPAQVALHELIEIAVEYGVDLARLDLGAQVFYHLVGLHHVRADLTPPPDLGLLAGDRV